MILQAEVAYAHQGSINDSFVIVNALGYNLDILEFPTQIVHLLGDKEQFVLLFLGSDVIRIIKLVQKYVRVNETRQELEAILQQNHGLGRLL